MNVFHCMNQTTVTGNRSSFCLRQNTVVLHLPCGRQLTGNVHPSCGGLDYHSRSHGYPCTTTLGSLSKHDPFTTRCLSLCNFFQRTFIQYGERRGEFGGTTCNLRRESLILDFHLPNFSSKDLGFTLELPTPFSKLSIFRSPLPRRTSRERGASDHNSICLIIAIAFSPFSDACNTSNTLSDQPAIRVTSSRCTLTGVLP